MTGDLAEAKQAQALDANPGNDLLAITTNKKMEAATMTTAKSSEDKIDNIAHEDKGEIIAQAMTLDVAYKSLEKIRELNLQLEFGEPEMNKKECIRCKREPLTLNRGVQGRVQKLISSRRMVHPCLACGTPVCSGHRSSNFGKQDITICLDCAHFFSIDYIMKFIVNDLDEEVRKGRINGMLEVYDRAVVILKFSVQFIDDVAIALEQNTSRHNKVGLGSSATGVMAGGLGVAAAVTIFTPVGPPLLLASILFGGSATAVNASSEAVNYRCEPNKMADQILTLYSIITCISQLPATIDMDMEDKHIIAVPVKDDKQSSLHWKRTAMNGLKPLTAGALSAVSIVTEAREMKNTVNKIRAGNSCEKAERLRAIEKEAEDIIPTDILASQLVVTMNRQS